MDGHVGRASSEADEAGFGPRSRGLLLRGSVRARPVLGLPWRTAPAVVPQRTRPAAQRSHTLSKTVGGPRPNSATSAPALRTPRQPHREGGCGSWRGDGSDRPARGRGPSTACASAGTSITTGVRPASPASGARTTGSAPSAAPVPNQRATVRRPNACRTRVRHRPASRPSVPVRPFHRSIMRWTLSASGPAAQVPTVARNTGLLARFRVDVFARPPRTVVRR